MAIGAEIPDSNRVTSQVSPRKTKIMIADDHASFRRMMKSLFRPSETEVIECVEGGEAISRYAETRPDWVLMDFEMEPVDGLVATRAITTRFPAARILMVTYRDDEDLREAAMEAGASHFILKDRVTDALKIIADGEKGKTRV
jgi:DNA-binding NarL/FixJ family response regulator